jgi:aminoglycoside phosphotransferase (APT) family kinase protein
VEGLLGAQHPDLAGLPIVPIAQGWDNALFRVGDDLVARLPIRKLGARLVAHEHEWLPRLAAVLPLPIAAPIRTGRPGRDYPWSWSICPWLPGQAALDTPPRDPSRAAEVLAAFVVALHAQPATGAPANEYRGHPLAQRDEVTRRRAHLLREQFDLPAVLTEWERALDAPAWSGAPVLLHGDLHPGNLLVHEGALSAVLDFGDLTAGDPATDLAVGWMLFDDANRHHFLDAYDPDDDALRARARGWALSLALAYVEGAARDARIGALGERVIRTLLAER